MIPQDFTDEFLRKIFFAEHLFVDRIDYDEKAGIFSVYFKDILGEDLPLENGCLTFWLPPYQSFIDYLYEMMRRKIVKPLIEMGDLGRATHVQKLLDEARKRT